MIHQAFSTKELSPQVQIDRLTGALPPEKFQHLLLYHKVEPERPLTAHMWYWPPS